MKRNTQNAFRCSVGISTITDQSASLCSGAPQRYQLSSKKPGILLFNVVGDSFTKAYGFKTHSLLRSNESFWDTLYNTTWTDIRRMRFLKVGLFFLRNKRVLLIFLWKRTRYINYIPCTRYCRSYRVCKACVANLKRIYWNSYYYSLWLRVLQYREYELLLYPWITSNPCDVYIQILGLYAVLETTVLMRFERSDSTRRERRQYYLRLNAHAVQKEKNCAIKNRVRVPVGMYTARAVHCCVCTRVYFTRQFLDTKNSRVHVTRCD